MSEYLDAERLRQATWIVRHPMDYTDREVRRAADTVRTLEAKREERREADRRAIEASRARLDAATEERVAAVRAMDDELASWQEDDAARRFEARVCSPAAMAVSDGAHEFAARLDSGDGEVA